MLNGLRRRPKRAASRSASRGPASSPRSSPTWSPRSTEAVRPRAPAAAWAPSRRHDRHARERAPSADDTPLLPRRCRRRRPTERRNTPAAITSLAQHRRERGADPESAARAARWQRGDRARRACHRGRPGCSGCIAPGRRSRRSAGSLSLRPDRFPAGPPSPAIKSDIAAARKLFAEWPTPVVAVGSEVGDALPYPGASIEKDFAWSPAHPVVDAYRASSRCRTTRRHPRWPRCFMPCIPKTATSRCPSPERSRCRMTAERGLRRQRTAGTGI